MNLQNIVVRVNEMSIGTAYDFNVHADVEVAKVVLGLEKGNSCPLDSLNMYVHMRAGAPNPFTLGQRLAITIDADAVPAVHEPTPALPRDEAVGLGGMADPFNAFDQAVMGVGTETMPAAPVKDEVHF